MRVFLISCAALLFAALGGGAYVALTPIAIGAAPSMTTRTDHLTSADIEHFATQVTKELQARDVDLAVLFRTGRSHERLPAGVLYTHGAFWLRSDDAPLGYEVYNLYHGEGPEQVFSRLRQDTPVDFIAGSVADDIAAIIPTPALQEKLRAMLQSERYEALHRTDYSLASNPMDMRYQSCNEFVLDVVVAAYHDLDGATAVKAKLEDTYMAPVLALTWLERKVAPLIEKRLRVDDHQGEIRTVTFKSLADYMTAQGMARDVVTFERDL